MEINEEYLEHHGILGMKWGVGKSSSKTSSGRSKKNLYISKDAKRAANLKKKKLYQLSNEELKTLNKRQELENKYRQNNKSKIEKGMMIVGSVAAGMGTMIALYSNGDKLIKIGQLIVSPVLKKLSKKV